MADLEIFRLNTNTYHSKV